MRDPRDPVAYARACQTDVPIELEALSYHSCPFVRARVAAKTNRLHVLGDLLDDPEPGVVTNAVDNVACTPALIQKVSASLPLHSHARWHAAWDALIRNPYTPENMRILLAHKERERQRSIREDVGLPPLPKLEPPKQPPIGKLTERRLALAVLRMYARNKGKLKKERVPWHITNAGWEAYVNHWSKVARMEAQEHPKCPKRFRSKKIKPAHES